MSVGHAVIATTTTTTSTTSTTLNECHHDIPLFRCHDGWLSNLQRDGGNQYGAGCRSRGFGGIIADVGVDGRCGGIGRHYFDHGRSHHFCGMVALG